MKVGTDGVLLGAWFSLSGKRSARMLDIGAGTGIISLMAAQRAYTYNILYKVDAIEIDAEAAAQARENIEQSPWKDNIRLLECSMQDFALQCSNETKYDIIVSNPPFYNATLKPEDSSRAIARHKDSLPLSEITNFAANHLSEAGELSLIYPTDYDSEVMTAAVLSGLHIIRICDVVTKKGKPCKRRMATFALNTHPQKEVMRQTLNIRDEANNYTAEYIMLTESFYLHLS